MIHSLLDFLRTLTTPDRLIQLLSTVLSGWLGYAALSAIVFAETGLLVGFFLPGDSLLFTVGVVAGAGPLNFVVVLLLVTRACLLGGSGGATDQLSSTVRTRVSSNRNTFSEPRHFTRSMAARPSSMPNSSRLSARLLPSSPESRTCAIRASCLSLSSVF